MVPTGLGRSSPERNPMVKSARRRWTILPICAGVVNFWWKTCSNLLGFLHSFAMPAWPDIALIIGAYLLGGLSPGYLLVRWRAGIDVRTTGSGGTGATNVGRLLGPKGYTTVLVVDLLKGALVGGAARAIGTPTAWAFAASFMVVAGHVWPIWLGFRGGKGVGPFVGSWLVLAPLALMPSLVIGLCLLAWLRRFSLAGLCSLIVMPAAAWWATGARSAVAIACMTISLLLWAHRANIRNFVAGRQQGPAAPPAGAPTNPK
jgi:acyl phosphate:glycerol-3-phosphate acyltransferase